MADHAWVCVNRSGHLIVGTIAPRRVDAIKRMVGYESEHYKSRWRYWKRNHGVTCERVRLIPTNGATHES